MNPPSSASFEAYAAERLDLQRESLTRAWIDRISADAGLRRRRVLPTDELLDRLPEALRSLAGMLRAGPEERSGAEERLEHQLRWIGVLRRAQGYEVEEVLREVEVLAQLLDAACADWVQSCPERPDPLSVSRIAGTMNRILMRMGRIGVAAYREAEGEDREEFAKRLQEFADTLLHELRTPLSAAETAALVLESDQIADSAQERRRFAGLIQRNLRRARARMEDVRAMALAQSAPVQAARWLPLGQVVGEVLAQVRDLVEEKRVRIGVRGPVPDVSVDALRVEIILLNLIESAAKYADPRKPVRWIHVGSEEGEDGTRWLWVRDNGLGVGGEGGDRIFERFYRAHPAVAEGSGLGLSIVREAARQLGARVEFESEPGVGSTFRVSLPTPEQRGDLT